MYSTVLNERFFKFINSYIFYIFNVLFGFHEKQKAFVVSNQSTVGAFRFSFTYLFLIRFKLFFEKCHKRVIVFTKTNVTVIDFLGCNETIMVANILIVLGNLRLDIIKFLIKSRGFFGFTFCPVDFNIAQRKGYFFLTTETCPSSIDGDMPHNRCLIVFTNCFFCVK